MIPSRCPLVTLRFDFLFAARPNPPAKEGGDFGSPPAATDRGVGGIRSRERGKNSRRRLLIQPPAQSPGEVLHELPGDAAGAAAARDRPFVGLGAQPLDRHVEAEMPGVALDDREIGRLVAIVEAEPEAEPVGERDFLLDRLGRVDRGRTLVLDHVARHQVPAVRGRVEQHVVGPSFDAALEHGLERLVARVAAVEGEIVAEQQEAARAAAQLLQEQGQRVEVLAMDFDQREFAAGLPADRRMHGFDQRALAGAARAPEQGVVGGKSAGELARVAQQDVARMVDPVQQREIDAIDLRHAFEPALARMPDEGLALARIVAVALRGHEPVERLGDPDQQRAQFLVVHACVPSHRRAGRRVTGRSQDVVFDKLLKFNEFLPRNGRRS